MKFKLSVREWQAVAEALENGVQWNTNAEILSGDYCNKTRDDKTATFASSRKMHKLFVKLQTLLLLKSSKSINYKLCLKY